MDTRFIGIGISTYDDPGYAPLPGAVRDAEEIAAALRERGVTVACLADATRAEVSRQLRLLLDGCDAAIVYWAGHGVAAGQDDLRLVVRDTDADAALDDAFVPAALAERALLSGARQVLLILDTCYSGTANATVIAMAAQSAGNRPQEHERRRWLGVVASAQSYEEAIGGRFARLLVKLLRDGPSSLEYRDEWSIHNNGISGRALVEALADEWDQPIQSPWFASFGIAKEMLPNPHYDAAAPDRLVEYLAPGRGAAPDEEGWYFTGRRRLLGDLVGWLGGSEPGLHVVTGPAGSGKSAVLGRLAALSDPGSRADLLEHGALAPGEPDPGEGSVDVVLHARGRGFADLFDSLAAALGIVAVSIHGVFERLARQARHPVIMVDALDEAQAPELRRIVEDLVIPLGRHSKALIGTRTGRLGDLEPALREHAVVHDLTEDPDTAEDIAAYVAARLAGSANLGVPAIAPELAARGGAGGFLYARMVTSHLRRHPVDATGAGWTRELADSVTAAFDSDLRDVAGADLEARARHLLTALASSFGRGLPARVVWPALASAVTGDDPYGGDDVRWVLLTFSRYIIEGGEDGQAVYRLFHQELVDHLGDADARTRVDLAVCRLATTDPADPYVRRHLAAHAGRAGAEGIALVRALADTDPGRHRPDLAEALQHHARRLARAAERDEASAVAETAVVVYRRLTADGASSALPGLAGALLLLADLQPQDYEAVRYNMEAVDIYRALCRTDRPAYLPLLARSLQLLAARRAAVALGYSESGDNEEAVHIYRQLTQANPGAYLPDLVAALHNLDADLVERDQFELAVLAAEEAVAAYRALVRSGISDHLLGLALNLRRLSRHLTRLDRHDDALGPVEEAVGILRHRTRQVPGLEQHLTETLLDLSTALHHAGRPAEAGAAADEATSGYRALARQTPGAFDADLALALLTTAKRRRDAGLDAAALASAEEAVAAYRALARRRRRYGIGLPEALHCLAALLWKAGGSDYALAAQREAADLIASTVRVESARRRRDNVDRATLAAPWFADEPLPAARQDEDAPDADADADADDDDDDDDDRDGDGDDIEASGRSAGVLPLIEVKAAVYDQLAAFRQELGLDGSARAASWQAVAAYDELGPDGSAALETARADALRRLCDLESAGGDAQAALIATERAVDAHRRLKDPDVEHRAQRARLLARLATQYDAAGEGATAHRFAVEAAEAYSDLAGDEPAYVPDLIASTFDLAKRMRRGNALDEALETVEIAVGMQRSLLAEAGTAPEHLALASMLRQQVEILDDLGRAEEALPAAEEAVRLLRQVAAADAAGAGPLGVGLLTLSALLADADRGAEAVTVVGEAVAVAVAYAGTGARDADSLLLVAHGIACIVLNGAGRLDEAVASAEAAADAMAGELSVVVADIDPDDIEAVAVAAAAVLAGAGREGAARTGLDAVLARLDQPWRRALLLAAWCAVTPTRPIPARVDDMTRAVRWLDDQPPPPPHGLVRVRNAIREVRAADATGFDAAWQEAGGALPDWLAVPDEAFVALHGTDEADPAAAVLAFARQHPDLLDQGALVVDEWLLEDPYDEPLTVQRELLRRIAASGADEVEEQLRQDAVLESWVRLEDWAATEEYLREHRDALLAARVRLDDDNQGPHAALLKLAAAGAEQTAFTLLRASDPQRRQAPLTVAVTTFDAGLLGALATVVRALPWGGGAWADAELLRLVAAALAGEADDLTVPGMPSQQRIRWMSRIARMIAGRPQHAVALLAIGDALSGEVEPADSDDTPTITLGRS